MVTGANGFIASHIVDQLIRLGYKVRGTVRTEAKGKWVQDYFDNKYGQGHLELVVVPAMEVKGAFDDAVKGIDLLVSCCITGLIFYRLRGSCSCRFQHLLLQEPQRCHSQCHCWCDPHSRGCRQRTLGQAIRFYLVFYCCHQSCVEQGIYHRRAVLEPSCH